MGDDAFLKRMYAEAKELDDKLGKLNKFLGNLPDNFSGAEESRLRNQYVAMTAYLRILNERIAAHS